MIMKDEIVPWEGQGSKENPYRLKTAKDLKLFSKRINKGGNFKKKCYQLVQDIDLGKEKWYPAGSDRHRFEGVFDGNGKCILNLVIQNYPNQNGFIGVLGAKGLVKKLSIVNAEISIYDNDCFAGGIVGENYGTIEGCETKNIVFQVYSEGIKRGGIAGGNFKGKIANCKSYSKVMKQEYNKDVIVSATVAYNPWTGYLKDNIAGSEIIL